MAFTELEQFPTRSFATINGSKLNKVVDYVNTMTGNATGGVTASSGALYQGKGTSSSPIDLGTTAGQTLVRWTATSAATTGDTRVMYLRQYWTGAGAGEALRAYGTVNGTNVATGGTVNGAHISLSVASGGTVSGAGHALRATLDYAASTTPGGTMDVAQFDTNFGAGATVQSGAAFCRFVNLTAVRLPNLFAIDSPDTTAMFVTAGTGAGSAGAAGGSVCSHVLKIQVGGTDYWIGLNNTNA